MVAAALNLILSDRDYEVRDRSAICAALVVGFLCYFACTYVLEASDLKTLQNEGAWRLNHCPVVDKECGSRTKYACSVMVPSSGTFIFGNEILKSHTTC